MFSAKLQGRELVLMNSTKYEVENIFNHVYTGEELYRVKVTYISEGIVYNVLTADDIKIINKIIE